MDGSNNDHDPHGDGDCISGKAFKSIVYLDSDEDVTGKNFKIVRVGLRDTYGKKTWISAENVSATWTTRNHQLVTKANRFTNSATTEQAVDFIKLEQAQMNAVTFKDISSCSANVKKAIAWAVSAGIVKGFTKERYGPLEKSTRLQVAIMLYRFYK